MPVEKNQLVLRENMRKVMASYCGNMLIQLTTKFFKIVVISSFLVSAMPRHYSNEERTNAIDDAVVSESPKKILGIHPSKFK